ncbi:hypothetical protein B296_00006160, partial [Ensete ventricosum]
TESGSEGRAGGEGWNGSAAGGAAGPVGGGHVAGASGDSARRSPHLRPHHPSPLFSASPSLSSPIPISEWLLLLLYQFVYHLFLFTFSLLSTAAVVFTVASVYAAKPVSFYSFLTAGRPIPPPPQDPPPCSSLSSSLSPSLSPPQDPPSLLFFLLFTLGLLALVLLAFVAVHVYIAALWHLASVVSVLEPLCNLAAMAKSCDLLRGLALMASALVVAYLGACGFIGALFFAPVRTAASKSPACPSRLSSVVLLSRCSLLSVLSACSCKACSTMCARATTTSRSTRAHCLITWVAIRGSTFRSRVPFSDGKLMSERKLYAQVTIPATASTSMPMQMPNDIYINVVHASTIASASMPTYLSDDPFVILHLCQLLVAIDDVAQPRKSH